jgi:tetratricopeptide (TPR) repeat protein
LGRALLKQYTTSQQAADLDEAIACLVETLEVIPVTTLAIELAGALGQRFEARGDLADLDEAIRRVRAATQHADAEADKGRALLTLGNLLCQTHEHRRRPTDLDEAIRVYKEAQSHLSDTGADWLLCRNNYSTALGDKYLRYGDPAALDEAILVAEDVVRRAQDSPREATYLVDLAAQLLTRDERLTNDADLERSIQSLEEASQLAGPATPEAAASALNLARAHERAYGRHGTALDLERAVECYRRACQVAEAHQLGLMPDVVRSWASFALRRRSWREAVEATTAGLEVFERLYRTNILRRDREAWQRAVRGIVLMNAYALARDGQLEGAVTSLERAWGRQLTESLGPGRADLREVERTDPTLLETYRAVVARLRPLELRDRHPGSNWNESVDSSGAREGRVLLRNARAEFADVIARFHSGGARPSAPGSEIDAIAGSLAEGQAIVYLFATPHGSLALIVSRRRASAAVEPAPSVDAVWADTFSVEDLNGILVRRENGAVAGGYLPGRSANLHWLESSLREALPLLGAQLIEPFAARLRALAVSDVTLVAGGMLSALPLAAATYVVNGGQSCLLDEFTVSSVPCATLLAHAHQSLNLDPGEGPSLLAVGNPLPLPEGFETLEGAEAEVKEIADRFGGRVVSLCGPKATYANVTSSLPGATHLHLACHGVFASANPLFSSLVLAGGEALTLGSVLFEVDVRRVRLVIMSACETAVVDLENLPEEAVGFPAGFMQAGVAGVVATLWPVGDVATGRLMSRFYEFLFQKDASGGPGPLRPAMALRQAQQSLRSRDPLDWAGFMFYGAG